MIHLDSFLNFYYIISYTGVIHMVGFFKAKWKLAHWRYLRTLQGEDISILGYLTEAEETDFDHMFEALLASWKIPESVIESASKVNIISTLRLITKILHIFY